MRQRLRWAIVALSVIGLLRGVSVPVVEALTGVRVAYTDYGHRGNVLIMDASGRFLTPVTTRAGSGVSYPHYSWSPDGRYLLLVRQHSLGQALLWDLLLMDSNGDLIRTLVTGAPWSPLFPPAWAVDGDQIAYVAKKMTAGTITHNAVNRLDIQGHFLLLFEYDSKDFYENSGPPPSDSLFEAETGQAMTAPSAQWSVSRSVVVYGTSPGPGLAMLNVHNGRLFVAHQASEAALSSLGVLALRNAGNVVLVDTATGGVIRTVAPGELPAWSSDGRTLYFERRTPGTPLLFHAVTGALTSSFPTYTSAIWRVRADGVGLVRLTSQDAFGFGPLRPLADGSVICSRVDNSRALWQHQPAGSAAYPPAQLSRYSPGVQIQRLDASGTVITLVGHAGRPATQP